ncbi:MAG: hypothetical protein IKV57_10770 [Clostridia bacterium]|nr:hypothetical protein [Clostridia bacterium]
MEDKTFYRLFWSVLVLCLLVTLCHMAYCIYAYQHCSIIYFIGKELW